MKAHKVNIKRSKAYLIEGHQEQPAHLDNEGMDMTNQFLSLRKKKTALGKDDFFDNTFDVREYFTRKKQSKIYRNVTMKGKKGDRNPKFISEKEMEELEESPEARNQKNNKEREKVYLEDIQFLKLEGHHDIPFKSFVEKLKEELNKDDSQYLEKKMAMFKNGKLPAQELFDCFYDVFGIKDVSCE